MCQPKMLVALLISIVAFSGHALAQCRGSSCGDEKVWIVAHGHGNNAYSYFDDEGYMKGLEHILIPEVCAAANMQCEMVWIPDQWCWNSLPGLHAFGGRGLMDGWVDACTRWDTTIERIHVFDFAMPFNNIAEIFFFVLPGNEGSFNRADMTGYRIGFVQGWYADEKCMARQQSDTRQNYILSVDQILYKNSPDEIYQALVDGEVDAVFGSKRWWAPQLDTGILVPVGEDDPLKCTLAGSGMMTRKDNDFIPNWNRGFQKLVANGRFQEICQYARENFDLRSGIDCLGS